MYNVAALKEAKELQQFILGIIDPNPYSPLNHRVSSLVNMIDNSINICKYWKNRQRCPFYPNCFFKHGNTYHNLAVLYTNNNTMQQQQQLQQQLHQLQRQHQSQHTQPQVQQAQQIQQRQQRKLRKFLLLKIIILHVHVMMALMM